MNPTILKHPEHPKAKPARAVRRIPGYRIIVGECLRFATGIAFERIGMEMKKLSGGKLRAAGYDERRRVLVVELDAGRFEYSGVTAEIYRRMTSVSSPWSFYRDNIEEEYPAKRIR